MGGPGVGTDSVGHCVEDISGGFCTVDDGGAQGVEGGQDGGEGVEGVVGEGGVALERLEASFCDDGEVSSAVEVDRVVVEDGDECDGLVGGEGRRVGVEGGQGAKGGLEEEETDGSAPAQVLGGFLGDEAGPGAGEGGRKKILGDERR